MQFLSSQQMKVLKEQLLPDAVPVVPADEGSEGAALAPVAVGAHQAICTGAIPPKLAPTHFSWTFQAHHVSTIVSSRAVGAVLSNHLWVMLPTGRGQGVTCTQPHHHHQHHHHHLHPQERRLLHLCRGVLSGTE